METLCCTSRCESAEKIMMNDRESLLHYIFFSFTIEKNTHMAWIIVLLLLSKQVIGNTSVRHCLL